MLVRVSYDRLSESESRFIGESVSLLLNDAFDVALCMEINMGMIRVLTDNQNTHKYLSNEEQADLSSIIKKYAYDVVKKEYIGDFIERFNLFYLMERANGKSYKEEFIYQKNSGEYWKVLLHYQVNNVIGGPIFYACFLNVNNEIMIQRENTLNRDVFGMFSAEYYTVILINLDKDTYQLIRSMEKDDLFFSCYDKFSDLRDAYAKAYVNREYRDMLLYVYDNYNLINEFDSGRGRIDLVYDSIYGWVNDNIRRMPDYHKGNRLVLYATRSYEKERAYELNEEKLRQERNNLQRIYDLIGDTYFSIQIVDLERRVIEIIKNPDDSPYEGVVIVPEYRELHEYIEYNIYEEDKENIEKIYSYDNLRTMFKDYKDIRTLEYRRYIDGEPKWISVRLQPLRIVDGEIREIMIAARNIDEQRLDAINKQNENMKLLEEKKDMFEFMESVSDSYLAVFIVNYSMNELRILSCAVDFIKALVEGPSDGIFGSKFKRYLEEYVEEEYRDKLMYIAKSDYVHRKLSASKRYEITYRNKKGNWITVTICRTHEYTDYNREVLCIFENSNERETSRMNLEKALCDAENANRAKTSFFANMSHDIRTPMNAILGMTDIAKDNIEDRERVTNCLEQIDISGKHLLQLINNVLDMTSIESGKLKLNIVDMNIDSFIDSIKAIAEPIAEKEGIELIFYTEEINHHNVMGDVLRLRQVIINLLTNALKYTNAGGRVSLKIKEKYSKSLKKSRYTFIITDNGIGMSKEFLEKIYRPYERNNIDGVTMPEGTGLGMSITKTFVDLMRGRIRIDSEEGKGTKVKVDIPLDIVITPENSKETNVDYDEIDLAGMKVLVVEDHDVNMLIMQNYLENAGIIMTGVRNGKEAVDAVTAASPEDYDVILMDVQMPVMNGYEAARNIRNLDSEYAKNVPIFALTANAFDEDVRRAVESGMNGHLAKPIRVEVLYKVLKQIAAGKYRINL